MCTINFVQELSLLSEKLTISELSTYKPVSTIDTFNNDIKTYIKTAFTPFEKTLFQIVRICRDDAMNYCRGNEIALARIEIDKVNTLLSNNNVSRNALFLMRSITLPTEAYFFYKTLEYEKAVERTLTTIHIVESVVQFIPAFYGTKIQQLRNLIRIDYKLGNFLDACLGCNDLMRHLCGDRNDIRSLRLSSNLLQQLPIIMQQAMFEEVFCESAYNLLLVDLDAISELYDLTFANLKTVTGSALNTTYLFMWTAALEEIIRQLPNSTLSLPKTLAFLALPQRRYSDLKFVLLAVLYRKIDRLNNASRTNIELAGALEAFINTHLANKKNIPLFQKIFSSVKV